MPPSKTKLEAIVARELPALQAALGLSRWTVEVVYEDLDDGDKEYPPKAMAFIRANYDKVLIKIRPDAHKDEADVTDTLRHELFHVLLSPFQLVEELINAATAGDKVRCDMADAVWTHADEAAVRNLEAMYQALQAAPRRNVK